MSVEYTDREKAMLVRLVSLTKGMEKMLELTKQQSALLEAVCKQRDDFLGLMEDWKKLALDRESDLMIQQRSEPKGMVV